jgi:hypothetical protein
MGTEHPEPPEGTSVLPLEKYLPPQLEELLALHVVKRSVAYLTGFFGLVGGILTIFGYNQITNAREGFEKAKQDLESQVKITRGRADSLQVQLGILKSDLEMGGALYRKSQDDYQRLREDAITQKATQEAQFEQQMGNLHSDLTGFREARDSAFNVRRDFLEQQQRWLTTVSAVDTGIQHIRENVGRVGENVGGLEQMIRQGVVITIKENTPSVLVGTPFMAHFRTATKNRVVGLVIENRDDGEVVWGPADIQELQAIDSIPPVNGLHYRFRVAYVLRSFLRPDAIGLQILRPERLNPAHSLATTH